MNMSRVLDAIEKKRFGLLRRLRPLIYGSDINRFKHARAASAWRRKYYREGGKLANSHFEAIYTTLFGLQKSFYANKTVIDIGCGPRGSLEWADNAAERVGLDPLSPVYLRLGAGRLAMKYVAAGSENIPFADGYFSVVSCINALDHVDDIDAALPEIKRIVSPGGSVLISVEIDHPPRDEEPVTLTEQQLLAAFSEFEIAYKKIYSLANARMSNNVAELMSLPEREEGSHGGAAMILHVVRPS